jgi:hypothetical protein
MAEYKCKYCSEKFAKPLDLARHVRMQHKRAKKRAKKAAAKPEPAPMSKALEAMGVLTGLQASSNLSAEEKKLLGDVAKTVEGLVPKSK